MCGTVKHLLLIVYYCHVLWASQKKCTAENVMSNGVPPRTNASYGWYGTKSITFPFSYHVQWQKLKICTGRHLFFSKKFINNFPCQKVPPSLLCLKLRIIIQSSVCMNNKGNDVKGEILFIKDTFPPRPFKTFFDHKAWPDLLFAAIKNIRRNPPRFDILRSSKETAF